MMSQLHQVQDSRSTANAHLNISMTSTQSHTSQPNPSESSHLVRRSIISIVLLFVVISVVSWIAWLIIHPEPPIFAINSFSMSNFSLSNSRIKADYDLQLSVKNPNEKVNLVIDHFEILFLHEAAIIVRIAWMEAVYLDKMSQQNRSTKFSRDFGHPLPLVAREFKDISNDWNKRRVVKFHVKMKIRTRFRSGIWLTKRSRMKVSCMNLVVKFSAAKQTGKLEGGRKDCSLHFA